MQIVTIILVLYSTADSCVRTCTEFFFKQCYDSTSTIIIHVLFQIIMIALLLQIFTIKLALNTTSNSYDITITVYLCRYIVVKTFLLLYIGKELLVLYSILDNIISVSTVFNRGEISYPFPYSERNASRF